MIQTILLATAVKGVVVAAAVIGITGLLIALLLGIAANVFAVPVDEKAVAIRETLPGANCGGCGYAGCDALAAAVAAGEAPVNGCPVGGAAVAEKIGAIMGVSAGDAVKQVAFVKCAGTCDKAGVKANYYGIADCKRAAAIPGKGDKACAYGCMGFGSCVAACNFDAIHVEHGVAVVDKEKCVACGKCAEECPNGLIELIPYDATKVVSCSNKDKGPKVMSVCEVGCIGCGLCAKQCEFDAITVENNIAHIDQSKCTGCGKCAEKCPKKIIRDHA
ncbi:MAG: RnfABCDGE type electron transport complex subunit B [Lachnospiraceae bacterium]|nr:RnfABCDGE type electron transport complex subunit B [Lachnospiraceae bacterium]